jgi:hypothetical protein
MNRSTAKVIERRAARRATTFKAKARARITSLVLIGLLIYIIGVGYRETHP